jgi:hypothetical protein
MRTALAMCQNIEDVFNALIKSVMEMMGITGTLEIEDFRRGWKELGPEIDGWIASAEHVSQGGDGDLFEPPAATREGRRCCRSGRRAALSPRRSAKSAPPNRASPRGGRRARASHRAGSCNSSPRNHQPTVTRVSRACRGE